MWRFETNMKPERRKGRKAHAERPDEATEHSDFQRWQARLYPHPERSFRSGMNNVTHGLAVTGTGTAIQVALLPSKPKVLT